ncbi:hypothetical protein [Shimia aestuarii]|uniref:O-antigen ligase like membrane protein n=1 Tax=Shimia aestuarii TaxID=254406 RepID=A0A1I4K0A8_9RHOB|nr:hypothetical protein [Shimia aestuarii]SFL72124.1 hypothetical protein SAMN04488042_1011258 [Shimia aestuarii]
MPNVIANLMLLLWPVVVWRLFVALPPGRALVWSLLGAYLLLPPPPAKFDLPLMPALDKESLPHLAVFGVVVFVLALKPKILPESRPARWLVLLFILSPVLTVATNSDPLIFTERYIRGLHLQDAIAQPINQFIMLIGFLMARNFLQTREDQRDMLLALLIAGLVYTIPTLMEVRLSPQINNWVYGYYQHLFSQTIRGGGYRPMVFLYHGIWLAYFMLTCLLAALALWRGDTRQSRIKFLIAACYLAVILVLCKTLAVLVYAGVAGLMIIMLSTGAQLRIAAALALIACLYPAFKAAGLVPTDFILAQAEAVSPERAASLAFRFQNEDILAARAFERPFFGWGIWGRNHLHDPVTGQITSVSDGYWVIVLGVWGAVGYAAQFGLLSLPIFLLWRRLGQARSDARTRFVRETSFSMRGDSHPRADLARVSVSPYVGPLALLLGVNLVDLLPNATLTPMTWIISGMLLGHAEMLARQRKEGVEEGLRAMPEPARRRTVL